MFPRKIIPTALGLWLGISNATGRGQEGAGPPIAEIPEPGRLALVPDAPRAGPNASQNQHMAETIAEQLRRSGGLRGYRVDIRFVEGVVELTGLVADDTQKAEVLRLVRSVPGVANVRDGLEVKGLVLASQGAGPESSVAAEKLVAEVQAAPADPHQGPFATVKGWRAPPPFAEGPQDPMSIMSGGNSANPGPTAQQPPMPPYAWPTVAPYNNYSRVGYPLLYRNESFPFIGPVYPFPKVPLGWRAVTLQWYDGFWYYGKKATGHDWWRIRYY